MKKILFLILFALTFAGANAQGTIYGRLKVVSGTSLNYIVGGADTLYFGWNDHTFSFFDKDTNKILEFGLADTAKFYTNLKFSTAYTDGTIYWPGAGNSYIRGNTLYFVNNTDFLQAIPTQIKISASTHDYATLNSYRLLLNKAAGVFIQNDTNGVLLYGTDYAVRDEQGFEYLRHNYGDSSTTISYLTVSSAAADTAVVIDGNLKADTIFGYVPQTAPYKVYVAILNQNGTNAPVATVLENTLDSVPIWSREDVGCYMLTLTNAFPPNKTIVFVGPPRRDGIALSGQDGNSSFIILNTINNISGIFLDDLLYDRSIEIRVYP